MNTAQFPQASFVEKWRLYRFNVLHNALKRLLQQPLQAIMTISAIAVTLALPSLLHWMLVNTQNMSYSWENTLQTSLFLRKSVSSAQAWRLTEKLQNHPNIEESKYISPEEAFEEFKRLSGFGEFLSDLDENPLPAVIAIQPKLGQTTEQAQNLLRELQALPEVESALLDQNWLERLFTILRIIKRAVYLLGVMLAVAVLIIIGNTIRLDMQSRRAEIEVTKLLGAPDGFILRPLLYSGALYGGLGAFFAWIVVHGCIFALNGPIQQLLGSYESRYELIGFGFANSVILLSVGLFIGVLSAWLVARGELKKLTLVG